MKKLKDLCLSVLINEGEEVVNVSPDMISDIIDVDFNVEDDYIKLDFSTPYGKDASAVAELGAFKSWVEHNKGEYKNMFKEFLIDFVSRSSEGDEGLNEIVDDDGNIMPDDDMPQNSTNSMIVSPKFDLEKIYKSFVPKSVRFYSGDLGLGIITW